MPLPGSVPTFTLVGDFPPLSPDGRERTGSFTFTPVPPVIADASGVYLGVENATLNASGGFSKQLAGCDAFGTPFVWRMDGDITGLPPISVNLSIPGSAGTVHLGTVMEAGAATLPANYVVVIGPRGATGPSGGGSGGGTPADTVAPGTSFGASPVAGSVGTYSRGDHAHGTPAAPTKATVGLGSVDNTSDAAKPVSSAVQTALASEVTRANAAYDAAGSAAAALVSAKAYTDAHPGTGGHAGVSSDGRINEEIIVLGAAASWTIVTTSLGVEIGATVAAAVGQRVWFSPSFLRTGGVVFLDIGIKAAAGGVSRYVSSGTSTPRAEGYAPLYPLVAFTGVVGIREFIVQAGEVDGSGNVKIVLAYKGPADGNQKLYFGSGYDGAIWTNNPDA